MHPTGVSVLKVDAASEPEIRTKGKPWRLIFRVLLLLATLVSLYFLFPSLVDTFTQWHSLADLEPWWILLALVFEAASTMALWEVQRIALRTPSWFAVGTAQLAGNAAGSVVPGGAATAGAFSYRMLVRAGVRGDDVAGGLAAVAIANTATILAFPVLALPAILGGLKAPHGLLTTAYIGAGAFVLAVLGGLAAFLWDRPLLLVGRGIDACPPAAAEQARRARNRRAPAAPARRSTARVRRPLARRPLRDRRQAGLRLPRSPLLPRRRRCAAGSVARRARLRGRDRCCR